MAHSKRQATHKQYQTYIAAWHTFCHAKAIDPLCPTVPQVIDYLEHLRTSRSLGYNSLNTARSALSSVLPLVQATPLGQHPLIKTYMRGAYNLNPPTPRYTETWDPDQLLTLLKTWSPCDTLSLKLLTFKLLLLILLVTGQRLQTVSLLYLDNMSKSDNCITFRITGLLKQSRPGYSNPFVKLRAYPKDIRLCVFTCFIEYVSRTRLLRVANRDLFISFKKPHAPVGKQTLARWTKIVMGMAHINTNVFAPHSVRSASTSAALRGGVPVQDILDKAGWARESVFGKFYNRPVHCVNNFDRAVLCST